MLCPFEFPAGSWCRPARHRPGCVVLWLPPCTPLPYGFSAWFLAGGGRLVDSHPCGGAVAVLLACPSPVASALLAAVPRPRSAGSRTPGVLLPV
jgi:hypothetical protein